MAISRTTVYGSLAVVVMGAVWWYYQDSPPAKKGAPVAAKTAPAKDVSEYTEEDFSAHFGAPKAKLRPVFMPLVIPTQDHAPETAVAKEPDGIPADLAGGDPNWTFTGYAVVNGVTMALLENQTTHRSELVKRGEKWKTSHLVAVTTGSIVLIGAEGVNHVVLRHIVKEPAAAQPAPGAPGVPGAPNPGSPNPAGAPNGPRPFNPANGVLRQMRGPISMPGGVTIINGDQ